ncbi:MAG: 50S ribosomal protein L7 [Lawsonibacter sp.]
MANDPILHLLGLAKKAGRLEIGEEPVGALCRARHARLVLLASDAAPNTRRRCAHFGETGNVLWLELPATKAELGFCLGRTSCAMLALSDAGFAASIVEKLSARTRSATAPPPSSCGPRPTGCSSASGKSVSTRKTCGRANASPGLRPPSPSRSSPPKIPRPRVPGPGRRPAPPKKPHRPGDTASHTKAGFDRPSRSNKPGPGGRRLSGKTIPKKRGGFPL